MFRLILLIALFTSTTIICCAQLSAKEKKEVIEAFNSKLQIKYVFPEISKSLSVQLLKNLQDGVYDTISSKSSFAFVLTRDVRQIANDLHLKITYEEAKPPKVKDTLQNKNNSIPFESLLKENNYGIKTKKIISGNVGYLEIPLFGPLNACADTIIKAMDFISSTDALVIDLRSCRGALDENTLLFFLSYFFDEPMHLSDLYEHEEGTTKQNWTYAWVPGSRYLNKPIYILTSSRTFSGGEAFAYDMQQIKRATIVGETTRGGAHPTELVRLNQSFTAGIPYARPINTVSKTNWEHTGVKPDTAVKSNIALYTAQLMALTKLATLITDKIKSDRLAAELEYVKTNRPVFRIVKFELNGYPDAKEVVVAGTFNSYSRNAFYLRKTGYIWAGEVEVEPGPMNYAFIVDGKWIPDPTNPDTIQVNDRLSSFRLVK